MTWTNAFDTGACTVAVRYSTSGSDDFSKTMAKGDSESFTIAALGAEFVIAVSDAGAVSLAGPALTSGGDLSLRVIPTSVGSNAVRASGITAAAGGNYTYAYGMGNLSGGESYEVPLSGGGPWEPDPCEMPTGSTEVGIVSGYQPS